MALPTGESHEDGISAQSFVLEPKYAFGRSQTHLANLLEHLSNLLIVYHLTKYTGESRKTT